MEFREGRYWLQGPLTMATVAGLRAEGLRQFASTGTGGAALQIDLSGVTEVDSSAISLFFEWERELARKGAHMSLYNMNKNMHSLASVYEVLDLLPVGQ